MISFDVLFTFFVHYMTWWTSFSFQILISNDADFLKDFSRKQ